MNQTMETYDVLIIGQGPAGLSGAIYTSRAGLSTLILGCEPRIAGDYDIDNYFGFPETISGRDLVERGVAQAKRFGTVIECEKVLGIHYTDDHHYRVSTERREILAASIILATGVSRKKPAIRQLDRFEGRGVSYCVSCDGYFFRNRRVMVAGEGNYAANQALELLTYTPLVSLCTLGADHTIAPEFMERLTAQGVPIVARTIDTLEGETALTGVVYTDGTRQDVDGLFIALGEASSTDFARSLGIFTDGIFIKADEKGATNVPGIFAAGDCTGGFLQISVAVGDGALAARSTIEYIKNRSR